MPVSVVCDAASVNAAIRESIGNSSSTSCSGLNDDAQNLQSNLIASTKRVLLSTIEYDELNMFSPLSVFDTTVKSKCISLIEPLNSGKLNQSSNGDKDSHQNSSSAQNANPGQQGNQRDVNQLPPPKKILFPRKSVQIGWKSSNRKWQIGAGMMNVGNTCYLNSTLQALFHVPAMANWLISDSTHREKCEDECGSQGGCIICAMSKTLIASQTSQSPIRPYLIYSKLKLVCKHLVMGRQEDAHEFLRYLVEAMEKSYLTRFRNSKELDQYSKETTPLNQILGGYLKSAVRCLACGHVSTTFQHFQDILLDIRKANTIEEALDGYFARERLEDMGYKCEACKKKVSATKQFSLERAPISLCIQLKRFSMLGTKMNKHVAFRPHLDLTPYASRKNGEQLKYKLVAMVTHLGASQHCGHYTAIGYTDGGSYYQFDDSCVRPISLQNVLNTNAYIIFYELEESQQHSRQTSTLVSSSNNEQVKINGQIHYNENNQHRQNPNSCANIPNGTAAVSISSKIISKLEISSTSTIIGPQLPDRTLLKNSHNASENGCINSDGQKITQNGLVSNNSYSKLVNSPSPSKLFKSNNENGGNSGTNPTSNVFSSPKQKENLHLGSKLTIHFKNANNNNSSGTGNSSNIFKGGNKFQESNGIRYQTLNATKIQTNDCDSSSTITNQNKSTLPSMPRLESSAIKESSLQNGLPSSLKNQENGRKSMVNGYSKTEKLPPVKSLVPYESDDESNDSACMNSSKSDYKFDNNGSRTNHHHSNNLKRSHDSSAESSSMFVDLLAGSPRPKQKTPPSPPVIKTKTGFWQVTSADVKPSASGNTNSPEKKNPFSAVSSSTSSISPSKYYSNNSNTPKVNGRDKNSNGYKWNEGYNNGESNDTVNHLLKFSHRGYGAPVLSWNGHKTDMEKEIIEENRLERKRDIRDEEENEMDRGRQKKIKTYTSMGRENPGYNPFQEYQNQYHQNRRWNNNHGHSNSGRQFQQNHTYRQGPFHRNQNNFRRHRFHQRPHQQRNGDHGFHHRRDS